MDKGVIEEGYEKALEVLKMNATEKGFSASTEKFVNYYSVWARDHSICALAACLTNDEELIKSAKNGIFFLLRKQADYGQIPSYVEIDSKAKVYGGLGTITSVDSNMWVAIAAASLYRKTKDRKFISDTNIKRLLNLYLLLRTFDLNDCGLMEVPVTGDWADIFDRSYHVLYDQCLYYQALKDLSFLFEERLKRRKKKDNENVIRYYKKDLRWIKKKTKNVKKRINESLWLTENNIDKIKEEYMIVSNIKKMNYEYYQSHLMPFKNYWYQRFDSFGNVLAMLVNIADKKKKETIIKYVIKNNINKPAPIMALWPVVYPYNRDWQPIYSNKERPYTYHNGGIWPVIAGFWINALSKYNMKLAEKELEVFAKKMKEDDWKFNEYLHGKSGKPMGRNYQAWSAAGYIIAYESIKHHVRIFHQ